MFQITIYHRIFSVLLILTMLQSCRFYKVKQAEISDKKTSEIMDENIANFYVVHLGDNLWQMDNVGVVNDTLRGSLQTINPIVKSYIEKAYADKSYRYPKGDAQYINQVHIHVDEFVRSGDEVKISKNMITNVFVMSKNKGLSALATSGIYIASIGGSIGIFLAIVCNCPHTYVFDGKSYYYNNTLFTGATSQNQERDDYKIMPDYQPDSDKYEIVVKNEDEELQYTNLLELVVVDHPKGINISVDQEGNVYSIRNPQAPLSAIDVTGADIGNIISFNDDSGHEFNSISEADYNDVITTFHKPEDVSNAKIIVKAKNTQWGGFVYNEFSKLFGDRYENWSKKNHKKSREEVESNLKKAGIPLVISVKQKDQWIDIEEFNLIGDVSYNSLTVSIDEHYLTDDNIQIRIRSGFNFWNVDYVAMDFSDNSALNVQYLSPSTVVGNKSTNDVIALSSDDDLYMEHLSKGDSSLLTFKGLNTNSETRTIYLHSKGYYLPQENYEGKMNRKELVKFRKPGEMSRYSKRLYNDLTRNYAFKSE